MSIDWIPELVTYRLVREVGAHFNPSHDYDGAINGDIYSIVNYPKLNISEIAETRSENCIHTKGSFRVVGCNSFSGTFSAVHNTNGGTNGIRIGPGKLTSTEIVFRSVAHGVAIDWSITKY